MATSSEPKSPPIFSGEFRHVLDEKKRIIIPSRWRHGGSAEFFVVPNPMKPCLTAMPPEVFRAAGEKIAAGVAPDKHRAFIRQFYSRAQILNADKQGRMLLPEDFRQSIGLKNESVLAGGLDRFDIWSPASWAKEKDTAEPIFKEVWEIGGL